jgi:hypothetical protein
MTQMLTDLVAKTLVFHTSRDFGKLRGCNFQKSREMGWQMEPTGLVADMPAEALTTDSIADRLGEGIGLTHVSLFRSVATAQRIERGRLMKGKSGPGCFVTATPA